MIKCHNEVWIILFYQKRRLNLILRSKNSFRNNVIVLGLLLLSLLLYHNSAPSSLQKMRPFSGLPSPKRDKKTHMVIISIKRMKIWTNKIGRIYILFSIIISKKYLIGTLNHSITLLLRASKKAKRQPCFFWKLKKRDVRLNEVSDVKETARPCLISENDHLNLFYEM